MARKLVDIEVHELSLVEKAANKKTFLFFKSEDELLKIIAKLNKRLDAVEEGLEDESDDDDDNPKWPSLSQRDDEEE